MESLVPEYDLLGHVRERTGSSLPGIVPSGTYRCADDRFVVIGANSDGLFRALMQLVGAPELAADPALADNAGRSADADRIDAAIARFTATAPCDAILAALADAGIPSGPIHSIADIATHPHVAARGMLTRTTLPDGTEVALPGYVPKLSRSAATTRWAGPPLGAHNAEIYGGLLGLSAEAIADLARIGAI